MTPTTKQPEAGDQAPSREKVKTDASLTSFRERRGNVDISEIKQSIMQSTRKPSRAQKRWVKNEHTNDVKMSLEEYMKRHEQGKTSGHQQPQQQRTDLGKLTIADVPNKRQNKLKAYKGNSQHIEELVSTLVEMGFNEDDASIALHDADNDINRALTVLMDNASSSSTASPKFHRNSDPHTKPKGQITRKPSTHNTDTYKPSQSVPHHKSKSKPLPHSINASHKRQSQPSTPVSGTRSQDLHHQQQHVIRQQRFQKHTSSSTIVWKENAIQQASSNSGAERQSVSKKTDSKRQFHPQKSSNYQQNQRQETRNLEQSHHNQSCRWQVGDKCDALFYDDGLVYPAVIMNIISNSLVLVRFEFYNNEQQTSLHHLFSPLQSSTIETPTRVSDTQFGTKKPIPRDQIQKKQTNTSCRAQISPPNQHQHSCTREDAEPEAEKTNSIATKRCNLRKGDRCTALFQGSMRAGFLTSNPKDGRYLWFNLIPLSAIIFQIVFLSYAVFTLIILGYCYVLFTDFARKGGQRIQISDIAST